MKKIWLFVKLLVLFAIACLLAVYLSAVFRPRKTELPNDTTNKVSGFYALQDNSLDVLFMGTSHTYYGFNPAVIYQETGLNSYVFAGECQPISVTYHYLVEALKTQKPQLIVLDVFALMPAADACQTDGIIKVNLEDFKLSLNKIEAYRLIKNENLLENLLDIAIYKDRWNEITEEDFQYPLTKHFNESFGYTEGYPVNQPIYVREEIDSEEVQIPDINELHALFQIFELARQNDIQILLVKTPYYETLKEHQMVNYLFQKAQEYGCSTLNFNDYYDELDFVFDRDADVWHCNIRGAWKVSLMLSERLKEMGIIAQHDDLYRDAYHKMYLKTIGNLMWTQPDASLYLSYLKDMNVSLLVNYKGKNECSLTHEQWDMLHELGIRRFDTKKNYLAVIDDEKIIYEKNTNEDYTDWIEFHDKTMTISSYDDFVIYDINGEQMEFNHYGLNLLILDETGTHLIDKISLDTIWGFEILR